MGTLDIVNDNNLMDDQEQRLQLRQDGHNDFTNPVKTMSKNIIHTGHLS